MYDVEFTSNSQKEFNKLSDKSAEMIAKKLHSIRENPLPYLKKLKGNKLWRLRVTKYRVLLDIIISRKKMIVIRIGLRKNVY